MRYLKGLIIVAALSVMAGYLINEYSTEEAGPSGFSQGVLVESAPVDPRSFSLPDRQGRLVDLTVFKGKPIILNFWATWCPPCVEELPSFATFAAWAKKNLGVETLAVSVDAGGWRAINKFLSEKKFWPLRRLPFTILSDTNGNVATSFGTVKYPETYFIDRNFKIIKKFVGSQDWSSREIMTWVTEHSR